MKLTDFFTDNNGVPFQDAAFKYEEPIKSTMGKVDHLAGGVGDDFSSVDVDLAQLSIGVQIEMEHTNDPDIATEISIDHLREDPKYYSKLIAAGLAKEFAPAANSGLGDSSSSINDLARTGGERIASSSNLKGSIGGTSNGQVVGRNSEPVVFKEDKSTTTYDEYKKIAEKTIEHLMRMARKKRKEYTAAEQQLTPSFVKSVLIGLGNSNPSLADKLNSLAPLAYKPKKS